MVSQFSIDVSERTIYARAIGNIATIATGFALPIIAYKSGVELSDILIPGTISATLGLGLVSEGYASQLIIDMVLGHDLRKENYEVKASQAIQKNQGTLGTKILEHFVRSRLGNYHFTLETDQGDLVQTLRGIAFVSNEGEIQGYGKCRTPEMNSPEVRQDSKIINIRYHSHDIPVRGGKHPNKQFSKLIIDTDSGIITRVNAGIEVAKSSQKRFRKKLGERNYAAEYLQEAEKSDNPNAITLAKVRKRDEEKNEK